MRTCRGRCLRYYISGEKKGMIDTFIEHLPGLPDNIRYDGEGHYWIALPLVCNVRGRLFFFSAIDQMARAFEFNQFAMV